ncbi:MAG: hypothetical protein RR280_01030 [Bacteroidaceae bacterium]
MNEFIEEKEIPLSDRILMRCKVEALNDYTSNSPMHLNADLGEDVLARGAALFDYLGAFEWGSDSDEDAALILAETGATIEHWQPFEDDSLEHVAGLIWDAYEVKVNFAKDIIRLHLATLPKQP